jgi:hypothetical protein
VRDDSPRTVDQVGDESMPARSQWTDEAPKATRPS